MVAESLARIGRLDPELGAFIEVWRDEALERVRTVDERLPLAGMPFAVKGTAGIRSYAARRLIGAGAVPVGSTSVPGPGTYWQTWGQGAHGRTLNPYRPDRTCGGSSAGSAVAVAAGMVPLATGSDGAGSVRIPAAWCGVFGLKTTNGLLPSPDRSGLASAGVLVRHVADAQRYLRCVLDGAGGGGAWGAGGPCGLGGAGVALPVPLPARLPVPATYSPDLGFAPPDADVARVVRAAVGRLAEAGVVRLEDPRAGASRAAGVSGGPGAPGAFALLDPREAWTAVRGGDPAAAVGVQEENDRRLDALFARTPLLLTPVTPNRPHGHEGPGERYSTALTWAFNLSGHPAASLPAGFTPDGCPVGLQMVARHGADAWLLDIARAAEELAAVAYVPPPAALRP